MLMDVAYTKLLQWLTNRVLISTSKKAQHNDKHLSSVCELTYLFRQLEIEGLALRSADRLHHLRSRTRHVRAGSA